MLCECMGGDWADVVAPKFNFDNVVYAFCLLFEITTTEGWVAVMNAATDVQEDMDMQPIRDNGHWVGISYLYFLLWIMIGSFFIMQLMVGVICDQFNAQKEENEHSGKGLFTTQAQEEWKNTLKFIQKMEPKRKLRPWHPWWFEYFYKRTEFDMFVMACIAVNSFMMTINHLTISDTSTNIITYANYLFALIFTFEAFAKIMAVGWSQYIRDAWNKFDFAVVIGTLIGIVVKLSGQEGVGGIASIVRLFRIGRVLRLTKNFPTLKRLFNTLMTSLPSIFNVFLLLMIFLFIFTVLGMQLFGRYKLNGDYNEHNSFQNFWVAALTLFRFLTGENWNGVLHSMTHADLPPDDKCEADPKLEEQDSYVKGEVDEWCRIGWQAKEDCVPLNQCGEIFSLYIYFYAYTLWSAM